MTTNDFWTDFRAQLPELGLTPTEFVLLREKAWEAQRSKQAERDHEITIPPRHPGYAALVAEAVLHLDGEIKRFRGALWMVVLADQGILRDKSPADVAEAALRYRRDRDHRPTDTDTEASA